MASKAEFDAAMKMAERMIAAGKSDAATQILLHATIKEVGALASAVERLAKRVIKLEEARDGQ